MARDTLGFSPPSEPNPCVRLWGPGPEGRQCKTCKRLVSHDFRRRYYKCELRKQTACAATDHRVGWRACAKYGEVGDAE
jgi:hypothetical protein